MTVALIDADIVAYVASASCEKKDDITGEIVVSESLDTALARIHKHMTDILQATEAVEYKAFLSGDTNFREEVNPEYKANRRYLRRPEYLNSCKEYLVTEWKARVTDGYEADDALGINQTDDTIICSIDKDLLMIPGNHYSWPIMRNGIEIREAKLHNVSQLEGLQTFYRQMLIGDTTDNILGVKGIGKVKAAKIINPLETEEQMHLTVLGLYDSKERFEMNADCLWIMQEEGVKFSDRNLWK